MGGGSGKKLRGGKFMNGHLSHEEQIFKQNYVFLHSKGFTWKQTLNIHGLRDTKKPPDPYRGICPDLGQDLRNTRDVMESMSREELSSLLNRRIRH